MASEQICVGCGAKPEEQFLDRCPACARYFCADCAYKSLGRRFCGESCARSFYYGDDEESDGGDHDYTD